MFTTLDDLKKGKGKPEDKKKSEAYSGGHNSGMAVEHPGDALVRQAREDMGKEMPPDKGGEVKKITLSLYRNGFQIDGGEFRDFKDPANQQFMDTLKKNRLPPELAKKYPDGNIDFSLDDHRDEDYTPPPPPKYVAYSGSGVSMGEEVKAESLGVNAEAGVKPDVDDSKETTKIQIRFHNGERVAQVFNVDQRVSDIHTYVMTAAPVDGSYVLVSGFPPKPLSDPNVSIKEAGLKGAQITQKLV